jgi:hypothetical protein
MKQAPHPLLAGLWRDGAAPAQAVACWQAQRDLLDALTQGLQRVSLDVDVPWAPLLRLPLATGDAALNSALQALDNTPADAAASELPGARSRAVASALGTPPSDDALPRSVPAEGHRATTTAAAVPVAATAIRRGVAGATPRTITAPAAASHWQQRAQRARLDDAYNLPLRSSGALSAAQAAGWAGSSAAALLPSTAAAAAVDPASSLSPLPAEAWRGLQPAVQRIEVLLARLQRPADDIRSGSPGSVVAQGAAEMLAAASARTAMSGGSPAAQPPGLAFAPLAPYDAPSIGATGFGGGLRGLAARAAAAASGSIAGATTVLPNAASSPPAAMPTRDAAWAGEPAPTPPDDDLLAERLAQLLKREALRDGIDLSEVRP